ncbi:hypothetical protein MTR67_043397 [Solanum verrucosum]|uniref:Uncharacterized protein n=1 Tax=Solanum verrucosum TaxID=315347 RepID=A0AAF0ZS18_SOLVR|nr:hypothetical protein MTR67_043397 [Solanum verrucosum]
MYCVKWQMENMIFAN